VSLVSFCSCLLFRMRSCSHSLHIPVPLLQLSAERLVMSFLVMEEAEEVRQSRGEVEVEAAAEEELA
jgi:hypothetical protein